LSIDFQIKQSNHLAGIYIIEPSIFKDGRGKIWTSYLKEDLNQLLPDDLFFKHDKFTFSKRNVLRGIHSDQKSWKLVSCVYGEVFQVVVDCRKDSKTLHQHESFILNEKVPLCILLPPMVGNAFYVTSDSALYHYKLAYKGDYLDANDQFTWIWNDNRFNIKWPSTSPILSDRDS